MKNFLPYVKTHFFILAVIGMVLLSFGCSQGDKENSNNEKLGASFIDDNFDGTAGIQGSWVSIRSGDFEFFVEETAYQKQGNINFIRVTTRVKSFARETHNLFYDYKRIMDADGKIYHSVDGNRSLNLQPHGEVTFVSFFEIPIAVNINSLHWGAYHDIYGINPKISLNPTPFTGR